jgi:dihydrofolate reductase
MFTVIMMLDSDRGYARNGRMPCTIPEHDASMLKEIRPPDPGRMNVLITDRLTYGTLPPSQRPPKGWHIIILDKNGRSSPGPNLGVASTFQDAWMKRTVVRMPIERTVVMGPIGDLDAVLRHPACGRLLVTHVPCGQCDQFIEDKTIGALFRCVRAMALKEHDGIRYRQMEYVRRTASATTEAESDTQ